MDYLSKIKEFKKLTERRKIFVRNYLNDPARNAYNAAIKSAYSEKSARGTASDILKDPLVIATVQKYNKLIAADHSKLRIDIVKQLSLIAFSNVKEFMAWSKNGLELTDSEELSDEVTAVISEISETLTMFGAAKKVKMHDKLSALKELNKMHGFYAAEKHEHSNPSGDMKPVINVTLPSNGREKK